MNKSIEIKLIAGDALSVECDVLALKYAQENFGLDHVVSDLIVYAGGDRQEISPKQGDFSIVDSVNGIKAKKIIFIGVITLYSFGYREIRDFSRRTLSALAESSPETKTLVMTLHGANYGLDEQESFSAEIAGLIDGIQSMGFPASLEKIIIIELDIGRANRLNILLRELVPSGFVSLESFGNNYVEQTSKEKLRSVGYDSGSKEHVFVAMPFKKEMDDVYHYGIQGAVNNAGFLCERADLSSFTGDVMQWVQDRINTAKFVIADLTDANPNVYLEVGYAWGRKIPVVLIVDDSESLKFDVKGQRCLTYTRIKDLEEVLTQELKALRKGDERTNS